MMKLLKFLSVRDITAISNANPVTVTVNGSFVAYNSLTLALRNHLKVAPVSVVNVSSSTIV